MEIGALSLLISEKGFDATMQKVAAIDAAATKVGAKQTALRVTALTTAAETALGRVDTIASTVAGKPVSLRVLLSGLTDVTTGIDAIEAAKERAETPVVIPVPPPDTGPATNALGALAEAEAVQEQRARALTEALAAAGAAGTSTAEKAKVLQSALAADQQATDQLSSATLQLDIRQRDGIDVIKLRTQALNELREAQNQLSREESLASGNFRVRSTPTASAGIPVAVGPQLGPATPEAEAFAQRAAATKAAFEAEAAAARQATIATTGADAALTRTSASTERLSPRLRTAANGLTAVAFAATASNGSFQSMALGAGLAGSALADAFGSSKMAAYASGIGAALVVAGTFVGILERMTDRASRTRTAIDSVLASIRGLRSSGEASAALAVAIRDLARAEDELAVARERLTRGGSPDAISIGADIAAFRTLQKVVDQYAEAGYIALAPDFLSGMGPNGGGSDSFSPDAVRGKISGSLDRETSVA